MSIYQEVSQPAAEALVNLSQNSNMASKMVTIGMVKTAMDLLYKPDTSITKLLVMLLVNLTQSDAGIASLLQVFQSSSSFSHSCCPSNVEYLYAFPFAILFSIFVSFI